RSKLTPRLANSGDDLLIYAAIEAAAPPQAIMEPFGLTESFLPCRVLKAPIARKLCVELLAANGADHGADGGGRVVRPEQAHVFAGIVMEADTGAIFLAQRLAILEKVAPAQDGEA